MGFVFCWIASALWSTASGCARFAADRGWLRRTRLGVRVISVGNIQVGGAGKTPLVAQIAREAEERGLRVCILCRGYGARWETVGGILLPKAEAEDKAADAAVCGDEAALLHDLAPRAFIGVGADRIRQFGKVLAAAGGKLDVVILDDGFQNWKLHKDLEIVAVTSARRGRVLFRDWAGALAAADLVVWTKGAERPESVRTPLIRIRFSLPPGEPARSPIWLVTGIADHDSARETAEAAGYSVARQVSFPDHARYAESTVRSTLATAKQAGCRVAITGKDWVKWRGLGVSSSEVVTLEPELIFDEGRSVWVQKLWGN